jgi:putative heme-binding domain-containing protein
MRFVACLAMVFLMDISAPAQPVEISAGEAVFNSNCANCHGMNASGGRGPDLHGQLRNGDQDADIKKVVQNGIAGTGMPAFHLDATDLDALIKYIQKLRHGAPPPPAPAGDLAAGKRLYQSHGCSGCHAIASEGSAFGPDLTRIGAGRSYEYLKTSVLDPSADVPDQYQGVNIIDGAGKQYRGICVNEDTFTIQVRLPNQEFVSFDKSSLRQLAHEKKSLMPAYSFSETDLKNLLFYLSSLTGASATTETQEQARPR